MPEQAAAPLRKAFVFAVVGDAHVSAASTAIRYLKHFSNADILLVQSRSGARADHDQVIEAEVPGHLNNHEASIFLKTNLLSLVGGLADRFCYLDSDVIAVRQDVDGIFNMLEGPVRFALDHVDLDTFSRWAVRCECPSGRCNHLREALLCSHGIDVVDPDWTLWNGGVFLFDHRAATFMETWHSIAMQNLGDPYWLTRDQGALAAAAWKLGLESAEPLPSTFNFIVDRMWGIPVDRRARATTADYCVRNDFSLVDDPARVQPRLIHFVNGGVGQTGWRHWDEVRSLLQG